MANLRVLLLISVLSGCGSQLKTTLEKPATQTKSGQFLFGASDSVSGGGIDLSSFQSKPLLLIFAGESCATCKAETENLIKHLPELNSLNLEIVTILAGAISEDALDWKNRLHVPWSVGFEENSQLFQKYCPAGSTPCSFIQRPDRGIVLHRYGLIEIDEIKNLLSN